ncbi:MAG: glutathione S-transferase family protein [Pseudomonadota bacterium]
MNQEVSEYKVYGMSASGNCYKVKLLLEQLGLPYRWQEIDTLKKETQTPQFLTLNPNGEVPTLEIAPGRYVPESNAILYYLAEGTPYWPADRYTRAQVLQWMFFEQYSHEPYVAVARFIRKFLPSDHVRRAELPRLHERGYKALKVMEQHLGKRDFFVGDGYSIADIALFAYTHVADEGGFELDRFPAINSWMGRIRSQPGFVAM